MNGPRRASSGAISAQPMRSGQRLVGDEPAVSGEAKTSGRTTAPPPMSQEEYETLVRSTPPGPLDLAARDLRLHHRWFALRFLGDDLGRSLFAAMEPAAAGQ